MFCPSCGSKLLDTAKFCTSCGRSFIGEAPLMQINSPEISIENIDIEKEKIQQELKPIVNVEDNKPPKIHYKESDLLEFLNEKFKENKRISKNVIIVAFEKYEDDVGTRTEQIIFEFLRAGTFVPVSEPTGNSLKEKLSSTGWISENQINKESDTLKSKPNYSPVESSDETIPPIKNRLSKKKYIIIGSAAVIIALFGILGYYIWNSYEYSNSENLYTIGDTNLFTEKGSGVIVTLNYGSKVNLSKRYIGSNEQYKKGKTEFGVGYIDSKQLISEVNFKKLNSILGNDYARELIDSPIYRTAILDFYQKESLDQDIWKVFALPNNSLYNTVYKGRIVDRYNNQNDLAVLFTNIQNREKILVLFTFNANEESFIVFEENAPKGSLIKNVYKDIYSEEYNIEYAFEQYDEDGNLNSEDVATQKVNSNIDFQSQIEYAEVEGAKPVVKVDNNKRVIVKAIPIELPEENTTVLPLPEVAVSEKFVKNQNENVFTKRNNVTLSGTIGGSKIILYLEIKSVDNNCNQLLGYYYYESQGSMKKKNINGQVCEGEFILREVNGYGDYIGKFTGSASKKGVIGRYLYGREERKLILNL